MSLRRSSAVKSSWAPYLVLVMALAPAGAVAQEAEEEEMWKEHPNHLSVVLAGTVERAEEEEDEAADTVGVDYEYRLSNFLGLGTVVERAFDPLDTTTALFVADLHFWRGLAVQTGPGVEHIDKRDREGGENDEAEDKFVYRIGALYEFERGRFTVSPQVHLDVTNETNSVIFAIAFGFGF